MDAVETFGSDEKSRMRKQEGAESTQVFAQGAHEFEITPEMNTMRQDDRDSQGIISEG